jgi:CspA family cold shock protein
MMGGGMAGGRGPGGPGGGARGGFGGPDRGGFGGGGSAGSSKYSLTFSLNFQNILNHTNLAAPVGNLGSGLFGESTSTAGGFGGFGAAPSAYNRRIDAQIRFSF